MSPTALHRAQEAAARQTQQLTHASWFYPLKGIHYSVTHPFLWPLLRARLLPCILLSTFVFSTLFIWTYLPQWAFLALFHGWHGAWLNATFLVLGEGAAITALLFEAFLVDEAQVDVFDAVCAIIRSQEARQLTQYCAQVLVNEGFSSLVSVTRPVDPLVTDPVKALGKPHHASIYAPFSLRQIVEFILLLPLNFIPWIGVPLFLWLTGYRAGPLQHWRYFTLKDFHKQDRNTFIQKRRRHYTAYVKEIQQCNPSTDKGRFGTVFLILQLVPVASMIFLLTTSAGSALWAADLERQGQEQDNPVQQSAEPEFPPPVYSEYEDDPV